MAAVSAMDARAGQPGRPGQQAERQQGQGHLRQPAQVIGPHMAFDQLPLGAFQRRQRFRNGGSSRAR